LAGAISIVCEEAAKATDHLEKSCYSCDASAAGTGWPSMNLLVDVFQRPPLEAVSG